MSLFIMEKVKSAIALQNPHGAIPLPRQPRINRRTTESLASDARRKELGQFLTPPSIAEFMASLFSARKETVNLTDAGADAGALSAALVKRLCSER